MKERPQWVLSISTTSSKPASGKKIDLRGPPQATEAISDKVMIERRFWFTSRTFVHKSLLILLICMSIFSCSSNKLEPAKTHVVSPDSIPSQESFNTIVTFSDSGK